MVALAQAVGNYIEKDCLIKDILFMVGVKNDSTNRIESVGFIRYVRVCAIITRRTLKRIS